MDPIAHQAEIGDVAGVMSAALGYLRYAAGRGQLGNVLS